MFVSRDYLFSTEWEDKVVMFRKHQRVSMGRLKQLRVNLPIFHRKFQWEDFSHFGMGRSTPYGSKIILTYP